IPMQHLQEGWRLALTDGYSADLLQDSERKVKLSVQRIEDALTQSAWLVGSSYSLAGIDAVAICNALTPLTPGILNEAATPRTVVWLDRTRARPAVRSALNTSRTGNPERAFAPGAEHSRWG